MPENNGGAQRLGLKTDLSQVLTEVDDARSEDHTRLFLREE